MPAPTAGIVPPTSALLPTGYPAAIPTFTPRPYPVDEPTAAVPPTAYPADDATATPAPTAGPVLITYRDYEIVPSTTTIKVGTEVTFAIEGDTHQPYAGAAEPWIFEAPADLQNTTWSYTFNDAQTMTILCGYHGNMSATLIVEP